MGSRIVQARNIRNNFVVLASTAAELITLLNKYQGTSSSDPDYLANVTIQLLPQDYEFTQDQLPLRVRSRMSLRGTGSRQTRLISNQTTLVDAKNIISGLEPYGTKAYNVTLEGFSIIGDAYAPAAIYFKGLSNSHIKDIQISEMTAAGSIGVQLDASIGFGVYYNTLHSVNIGFPGPGTGCAIGFRLKTTDFATEPRRANANHLVMCVASWCTDAGYELDGASTCTLTACDTEWGDVGLRVLNSINTVVLGGHYENHDIADIQLGTLSGPAAPSQQTLIFQPALASTTRLAGQSLGSTGDVYLVSEDTTSPTPTKYDGNWHDKAYIRSLAASYAEYSAFATSSRVGYYKMSGDTNYRMEIFNDGKIKFGSGSAATNAGIEWQTATTNGTLAVISGCDLKVNGAYNNGRLRLGTNYLHVDGSNNLRFTVGEPGSAGAGTSVIQTITLTGDVTGTGTGSFAATIGAGTVTLAKMANMATASLIYRKTAGTGAPEVQTLATLKTDLGLTGTNSGDQTITLTGDVTGSGTGSFAATIGAAAVTLAKMANVATASVFYRKTAGTGAPEVQTLATLKTDLGLTGTNSGDQTITLTGNVTGSGTGSFATTIGTGVVTNAMLAGSIAASKLIKTDITTVGTITSGTWSTGAVIGGATMTLGSDATGDLYYRNASGVLTRLAIGTSTQILTVSGGGLPVWSSPAGGGDALVANPLSQFAATTSAQLAGVISDETGTGALVFATSPTLVTPTLGVASATTINKVALTAPATGSTLTIADGQTLTVNGSATITNGTHSGTNTGDQTITLTGDVTGSGTGSFSATIGAGVVSLAKMANVATGTLFYRKTAGTGAPEVQTLATLKTDLGLTGTNSGDQTLNALTGGAFTIAVGTTGSDVNVAAAGSTVTIHIPTAGSGTRGVVSTGTQTFAGAKTFGQVTVTGVADVVELDIYPLVTQTVNQQQWRSTGGIVATYVDSAGRLVCGSGSFAVTSSFHCAMWQNGAYGWASAAVSGTSSIDTAMIRDGGAGLVGMRNSTTPHSLRIYNTYSSGSNYERGEIGFVSNVFTIGCSAAGAGTLRDIMVGVTGNKLGFYGATPIARPTTGYSAATFTANSGTAVNDASTFDGYTINQIVAALRGLGLLT